MLLSQYGDGRKSLEENIHVLYFDVLTDSFLIQHHSSSISTTKSDQLSPAFSTFTEWWM